MKTHLHRLVVVVAVLGTPGCNFQAIEAQTKEMQAEVEKLHRAADAVGREHQGMILETGRLQNSSVRPQTVASQLKAIEAKLAATTGELDEATRNLEQKKAFLQSYTAQFGRR